MLASAGCAVTPAITFALLAQLILIEARNAQFLADLLARLALAQLPVPPAITLALLPKPIFVFAGEPQLFALASASPATTIIYTDAAGSDLKCLSRDRGGYKKCCHGKDEGKLAHGTDPSWDVSGNGLSRARFRLMFSRLAPPGTSSALKRLARKEVTAGSISKRVRTTLRGTIQPARSLMGGTT